MNICYLADHDCAQALHWAERLGTKKQRLTVLSYGHVRIHPAFRCIRLGERFRFNKLIRQSILLRKVLKAVKPDVLHAFYSTSYGFLASLLGERNLIVTVQGSDLFLEPRRNGIFSYINRFVFKRARIIHSMAAPMTRELVRQGVPAHKIVTFPEGVESASFSSNRRFPRSARGLISTRSMKKVYNIERLIDAMKILSEEKVSARLTLVGEGPEKEGLIRRARSLHLTNVVFRPRLSRTAYIETLKKNAIYVSTSLSDGASASLMEAMAAGLFPVVSDIAANRALITHNRNGLLFDPGDSRDIAGKIGQALDFPRWRERAVRFNRDQVRKEFDIGRTTDILISVYKRMVVADK
ncbi:glycosyltransferase [bacterium]|nr:glycosyltransferase [bacterium]